MACEAGLYLAISTIGTRQKIGSGELERMYLLAEQWGARELRLLAPVATGSAVGCEAFMLRPEERQALCDFHIRHNRQRRGPAVASFAYLESPEVFGCGAGYHHLFIDAAGEVCPCDLTPLSFGDATQRPLHEIWEEMGQLFSRPRCRCLMGEVASRGCDWASAQQLPLPPEESRRLCAGTTMGQSLPEGYRRLLR
jgi:radical SAM protein with 4Fe4S-binding SPASM domain